MSKKRDDLKPTGLFTKRAGDTSNIFGDLDMSPISDEVEVPAPIAYDETTDTTTVGNIAISSVGIAYIPDDVTEDEWLSTEILTQQVQQSWWWIMADLAIFAHDQWKKDAKWVADQFDCTPEAVENLIAVAKPVEFSLRRDKLTSAHYQQVLSLSVSERLQYLTKAVQEEWTPEELAFQIALHRLPKADRLVKELEQRAVDDQQLFASLEDTQLTQAEREAITQQAEKLISTIEQGLQQLEEKENE